jgi:hypothetical protein
MDLCQYKMVRLHGRCGRGERLVDHVKADRRGIAASAG